MPDAHATPDRAADAYGPRHPTIKCGACGDHRPYGDAAMWWLIAHESILHRWNPYYWIKRRLAS